MNKILLVSKLLLTTLLSFAFLQLAAIDEVHALLPLNSEEDLAVVNRLNNLNSVVEVKYTKEVKDRIHNYVHQYPKGSEKILGRVSLYFPIIEKEIRERNLPEGLKYLAVVESALSTTAKSRSGASGLWQFMPGTARMYGLKVNAEVDERRDAVKSTMAALEYLEDLNNQFGDWTLALAAYNCGPGNVRKAIRRSGGKRNYWEIRQFLPSETREYIPRHIAANYLMQYYYEYNLIPEVQESQLSVTTTIKVFDQTRFSELQKISGISASDIQFLNPSYLKKYIPNSKEGAYLTLPEEAMSKYLNFSGEYENLVFIQANGRILSPQALKRTESIEKLPLIDQMGQRNALEKVMKLQSPMRTDLSALDNFNSSAIRKDFYVYHELKKRESIYDLVRLYEDVSMKDLLNLNNLTEMNPPKMGDLIKIRRK